MSKMRSRSKMQNNENAEAAKMQNNENAEATTMQKQRKCRSGENAEATTTSYMYNNHYSRNFNFNYS